jgi:FdhE protein
MTISDSDRRVLDGLAAARTEHDALADLLDFYFELYEVQFEVKTELPEPELRDELAMRWRLEGGIPQLTFEQLRLEPELFGQVVSQVVGVLLRHNPTWQIEPEERTAAELVSLAREVFETWDTLTSPKPDGRADDGDRSWSGQPIALAVGFALAPYLQQAAEAILPRLDLSLWVQGYCPICGGRPNLALLEQARGARQLICSRCNALWSYSRVGCSFCKSKEKQIYYPSEDGLYRLYVCPDCNGYLKTVDLREVQREVNPVVERLVTVGMDLAAREHGLGG